MIWLDTDEKWDWFMNVLDNNELQVVSKKLTKEDDEEICRAIKEHKAMHLKNKIVKEAVLA